MNARNKLNADALQGAFLVAGIGGVLAGSWRLFFLLFALLIAVMVISGEIRLKPRPKRRPRPKRLR